MRISVKPSLRESFAVSHIVAIAALTLIVWSVYWVMKALFPFTESLSGPAVSVVVYIATAAAIRGVPASSPAFDTADLLTSVIALAYVLNALVSLAAAWALTRWVYGPGSLRALKSLHVSFRRPYI